MQGHRFGWIVVTVAIAIGLGSCAGTPPAIAPAAEAPVDPGWAMRMVDTSIRTELPFPFIKLVDLSLLRIGMTEAQVRAIFPDPIEIQLKQGDAFWQYGFVELIFRNGRLRAWFEL